jgi:hypothetical protein
MFSRLGNKLNDNVFNSELESIITIFNEGCEDEPMDVTDVENLIFILKNKINLMQGNITNHEFEMRLKRYKNSL